MISETLKLKIQKKGGIVSCSETGQPTLYHQLCTVSAVT